MRIYLIMKSLIFGLFVSTCQSQFTYPSLNEVLYADNSYNISWNSSNSELHNQNDLHLFLTNYIDNIHNNITISNYDNGSAILESYIGNESNYEWDIPYELNKYNIHLHNFKLLLSNTSTPFVYTLGNPNFLYYYSDYFRIYSNLSISHPTFHEIVNPNTSYISYHGFHDNLSISFLYQSPLTGSYIPIPGLTYDVEPSDSPYDIDYTNLHPYSHTLLQAKIIESISNIELSSAPFYLMGINITTPSNVSYINPSNILLTWDNYNYNGSNTIYINYQNILLDTIFITNTHYNLDVSTYNSGIYNISITNDLYPSQIYQNILLNIVFSTTTTTATTSTTTTATTATDTSTTATDTSTTDTSTTATDTSTTATDTSTDTSTTATDTSTDTATTATDTSTTTTDTSTTTTDTSTTTTATTATTTTATTATDTSATAITSTDITTLTTLTTGSACFNCTGNFGNGSNDSDDFNYLYIILIIGGAILITLFAYYVYRKCKQMKKKHNERRVSPQESIKMEQISYRTDYAGTGGFVDTNSHEYNHLRKERIFVNDNYRTADDTSTSTNSSISYHVRTYSNQYDDAIIHAGDVKC